MATILTTASGAAETEAAIAPDRAAANGSAAAAFVAAGIGAFAMGLVMILNEAGILAVPALYAPAGGVTGRTTAATAVWLLAWGVLHSRWKARQVEWRRVYLVTLVLIALGLLGTFPPVWGLF